MKYSFSLGQRIALSLSILVLLVLFASGLGLWYARTSAFSVDLTQESVEQVNRLATMEGTWKDITSTLDRMLLTRQIGLTGEQLRSQMQTFNGQLDDLQAEPMGVDASAIDQNEAIIADLQFYREDLNEIVDDLMIAAQQGNWAEAQVLRHTELAATQRRFSERLDDLRQNTQNEAQQLVAEAEAQRQTIAVYLIAGTALAILIGISSTVLSVRTISRPIYELTQSVQEVTEGNFAFHAPIERKDEIGDLSRSFSMMTEWLQESYQVLEERVAERTEDLALAAQVGQTLARVRDLDVLLQEAVDSIRDRFDLYYTQVYLTSDDGRSLLLRAGTGDVGRQLRQRDFRLPVDRRSINGTAALDQRPIIIPDTSQSGIFRPNPLLPDTQSEIAVPLLAGDRVVGVLDLQSARRYGLSEENLDAFEVLAGQLAIAIENALLFADVRAARSEMEAQVKRGVSEHWQAFLDAIRRRERIAFAYEQGSVVAAERPLPSQGDEAVLTKEIALNNARIGAIQVQGADAAWSKDQLELVDVVARQVAQQVENLRLLAEAERYRQEAELAVQRLTREGWREFFTGGAAEPATYVYDGQQVAKAPEPNGEPALKRPLQVRGEAVGELLIDENGAALDDEASSLVAEVAERLSAHLENLRLTHQTESALANAERRSAELGLLNRVVTEIAGTLDLRQSLQIVVEELVGATAADQARIALLNEERTALTVMAEEYDETRAPSAMGVVIPVEGNALTQEVIDTREPVIVDNALTSPRTRPIHGMLREQGIQSMAIMPILAGEEVIGTVGLDILEQGRAFSAEELRLAQTVIFQAATSIQNAHLFEQVQTALAETRVLYQAGAELNRARSYDDVLEVVRRHTVLGEQKSSVSLVMFDTPWTDAGPPQWMDVLAFHNPGDIDDEVSKRRFRLDEFPAVERLMHRDRYGLIRDVKTDPRLDNRSRQVLLQRFKARTILAMPLVVGGQWIGHISARYPELTDFKESELQRLRNLVGQAAVAVQSINLLEETSRLLEGEQRQRRISDTLVRATVRMMDVTDEHQIREVVVDEIESLVHPDQISLYEWDRQRDLLRVDIRKVDSRAQEVDSFSAGDLVQRNQRPDLWRALEEREPIQEPITLPGGIDREHYSVPWYVGSEVGGVIELYHSPRSGEVRLEDRGSIEGIIQQAAVRLQNARLYEEAELRAEELAILNEMAQALTALSDVPSVLDTVHRYSSRLLDTTNFYIALYDSHENQISFPIFVEEGEAVDWPAREPGNGLTEYVMREGEPLLISGDARERTKEMGLDAVGTTAKSWLGAPMLFGEEVSGVIAVQSNTTSELFDEHDRGLLSAVANAAAIALQNARLFEEAQARARRERVLREITTRVRSATDVDVIMKTAVREVSRALGRDAFVYLGGDGERPNGDGETSSDSTTVKETG